MGHYKANLRDLEFTLFEVLGRDAILGAGPFADVDVDTARSILDEVRKIAEGPLAASFADADRNPPTFDPEAHSVTLPESFKASYRAYVDGGWDRLGVDADLGGPGLPSSVVWAACEMVIGANPAIHMYGSGAAFAQILHRLGTPEQQTFAELMLDRGWASTMVLTSRTPGPTSAWGAPRRSSSLTAAGTSRGSSGSSPAATGTCRRTSCTSCWPDRRVPDPEPRDSRCSLFPSSMLTSRPASSATATASSSPMSRRRWA